MDLGGARPQRDRGGAVQAARAYALLDIAVRLKPGVISVAVDPEERTGSTQVLDDEEIKRSHKV